jgi:TrmH family RNA methyltransferase
MGHPVAAVITSTSNTQVKRLLALRKRRERDSTGRFLVEGRREVARALAAEVVVDTVVVCPTIGDADELERLATLAVDAGATRLDVAVPVFERLSQREGPDGLLVEARAFPTDLERIELGPNPLVLVAAEIEKPGNLGAMLRSAAGAGADAVIVADPVTDVFNPNVVRSSQGALFGLPVAVGSAEDVAAWLHQHGVRIYAAGPAGGVPHWDAPLQAASAIVVGAEHDGLDERWQDLADTWITIPMPGAGAADGHGDTGVDSLNVATAAAVLLLDAVRQRTWVGDDVDLDLSEG